jgi:hypothetical protein
MKNKPKYYKLGKNAASFYDPVLKLKIHGKGVGRLSGVNPTKRVVNSIKHGHIVETSEDEYNSWITAQSGSQSAIESSSETLDITKLDSKKLTEYYRSNYEASNEDVKVFDKLTKAEKLIFLGNDEEVDEETED